MRDVFRGVWGWEVGGEEVGVVIVVAVPSLSSPWSSSS